LLEKKQPDSGEFVKTQMVVQDAEEAVCEDMKEIELSDPTKSLGRLKQIKTGVDEQEQKPGRQGYVQ